MQIHLRASPLAGPEGAGETVEDPSSDEERATTDGESEVEAEAEEADLPPEEPWCPPNPTEMMNSSQPQANVFFQPDNLGALHTCACRLNLHLFDVHTRQVCRLFMSIAAELWLRDAIETVEEVFTHAARNFTLRLAEKLAQYICSLTRRAESLAIPGTECLLYATYWFRLILSELIGAAMESADVNRERAPSGPVKVVVTNRPHSAPQWCRSCQRSLRPPGVVSCKLGLQDCTVLHRGRRWLRTTPARSCHCLSSSRVRRTTKGCG